MKNLLNHLLTGGLPVTEYSTITVPVDICEKVVLELDHQTIDISSQQWLLCLDPLVFGIWLSKEKMVSIPREQTHYRIRFIDTGSHNRTTADLKLDFFGALKEPEGTLVLLKLKDVWVHHIHFIKSRVLFYRHYQKPAHSYKKLKSFAAAYSYPRKVRLISFGNEAGHNIFPMDLVGEIPSVNRYVFGLRHTNTSLKDIVASGKIVACEVPYQYKSVIYQLGKHHQHSMTESALPFEVIRSAGFGFPVPAWSNSYKELKIIQTKNLGSHLLLWAEVLHEETLSIPGGHLFHIHFLHYLHQLKTGDPYPLVL